MTWQPASQPLSQKVTASMMQISELPQQQYF
jgi:hypothetical protein